MVRKRLLLFLFLFGTLSLYAVNTCFSIEGEAGRFTPVNPSYLEGSYDLHKICTVFDRPTLYKNNKVYVGCYRTRDEAMEALKSFDFNIHNPVVVEHIPKPGDPYLLIPLSSTVELDEVKRRLKKVYEANKPEALLKRFPKHFTHGKIALIRSKKIGFLPLRNLYELDRWSGKEKGRRYLLIYRGNYDIETLWEDLNDSKLIHKVDKSTYDIRVPIVVGPMASLTIQNKTVHLEAYPRPMMIFSFGKLYFSGSRFLVWDFRNNRYAEREAIPEKSLLYLGVERPRPYIMNLAGGSLLFVDNLFKGLGYHGTIGPFGISFVHYPSDTPFVSPSYMLNFLIGTLPKPRGALVGNDIEDGSMGFYSNDSGEAILLGNYLHDNMIYNVDPHDYSEDLVIARNLSVRALHAHGIVISRHVGHTIIAENLMMNNHAGGIMFDRNSNNNAIYNNVAINNGFMGISIQESANSLISDNYIVANHMDGIILRNSLQMSVVGNHIEGNGKNGIELLIKDIDDTLTREFPRDPYVKAASAVVRDNVLKENISADIKVKNSSAIAMKENQVGENGIAYGGDLNAFLAEITQREGDFTLYGRGFPFLGTSTDLATMHPDVYTLAKKIFMEIYLAPNPESALILSGMYLEKKQRDLAVMEMGRAGSNIEKKILAYLGYWLMIESRKEQWRNKEFIREALVLLVESIILDNRYTARDLSQLHYFLPITDEDIEKAFTVAKERMEEGRLFSEKDYAKSVLCRRTLYNAYETKSALQIFLYRMRDAGEKKFLAFCKKETAAFRYLTPVIVGTAQEKYKENNRIKDMPGILMEKYHETALESPICRHFLQKQRFSDKETSSLLETLKKMKKEKWRPILERHLALINEFRLRKITIEQVYAILDSKIPSYEEYVLEREAKSLAAESVGESNATRRASEALSRKTESTINR